MMRPSRSRLDPRMCLRVGSFAITAGRVSCTTAGSTATICASVTLSAGRLVSVMECHFFIPWIHAGWNVGHAAVNHGAHRGERLLPAGDDPVQVELAGPVLD